MPALFAGRTGANFLGTFPGGIRSSCCEELQRLANVGSRKNWDYMRTIKYFIIALACAATLVSAQQQENPYLRALREQQERQAELRRQQEEVNRRNAEELNRQAEERRRKQREEAAAAREEAQRLNEENRRRRAEREAENQASQREAQRLNQLNQQRREERERSLRTNRTPEVVQRQVISRTPVTEMKEVGGHGTPLRMERVTTGYNVTYRIVYDNETSATETVFEPN